MLIINYEGISETYASVHEIENKLLRSPRAFLFQMNVERARHYSDLAFYYLEAAYIGQKLTKFSNRISFKLDWESGYHPKAKFKLKPIDIKSLSNLIWELGLIQIGEDDEICSNFMEEIIDYRENLENLQHAFPELVDDYYANFINGEYYEYDEIDNKDFFEKEFQSFPERRFGFWKCAYTNTSDDFYYVSTSSWIIPKKSNLKKILKKYSGIENLRFIPADLLLINNIPLLVSNGIIVKFPFSNFVKAKQCSNLALSESDFFNSRDWPDDLLNFKSLGSNKNDSKTGLHLSEYADHILIEDLNFYYLFFGTDKLAYKELINLSSKLSNIFFTATNLAGIHVEIKCPWEQLNDQTFEEICFDIIYYNPKFDHSTIRKMGKTRSRDGGRDIEAYTYSILGQPGQKYIFQCKYQKPGSSLTGSKVQDISDTITQFGAAGYGIMTNVVIDATLYDKLDKIGLNMKVEIEDYSVYKLERILACYPQLKQRHFK